MMKNKNLTKKTSLKQQRVFDITIRKQVVKDVEDGKCSIAQASQELGVHLNTIYRWLNMYSRYLKSNKTIVVQKKSEAYRTAELEKKIKELEAALGRKSLEIEFLDKIIELADRDLNTDLKKNIGEKLLKNSTKSGAKKDSE